MAEERPGETDGEPGGVDRPTAASLIADLWEEREATRSTPPAPAPTGARGPRSRTDAGTGGDARKAVVAVVTVVLLLGAGVGIFLAGRLVDVEVHDHGRRRVPARERRRGRRGHALQLSRAGDENAVRDT